MKLIISQETFSLFSMQSRVSLVSSKERNGLAIHVSPNNEPSKHCSNEEEGKEKTQDDLTSMSRNDLILSDIINSVSWSAITWPSGCVQYVTRVACTCSVVAISIKPVARSRAEVIVVSTGNLGVLLIGNNVQVVASSVD